MQIHLKISCNWIQEWLDTLLVWWSRCDRPKLYDRDYQCCANINMTGLKHVSRPVEQFPILTKGLGWGAKSMQTDRQTGLVAGGCNVPWVSKLSGQIDKLFQSIIYYLTIQFSYHYISLSVPSLSRLDIYRSKEYGPFIDFCRTLVAIHM